MISLSRRTVAAAAIALLAAAPRSAAAQPANTTTADKLFVEGRALLDAGRFGDACEKFARSRDLNASSVGVYLNLGLCNEKQEKFATALRWYRDGKKRALASKLANFAAAADERINALLLLVPTISIQFTNPADAALPSLSIEIDDVVQPNNALAKIELDPGHHEIRIQAEDRDAVEREVELKSASGDTPLLVNWTPSQAFPKGAPLPVKPEDGTSGPRRSHRKLYGIVMAGGGVVLGAVDLGLLIKWKGDNDDATDKTPDPTKAKKSAENARYYGTGMTVISLGLVAAGAYLYFTAPSESAVRIAPVATPEGGGVSLSGRF